MLAFSILKVRREKAEVEKRRKKEEKKKEKRRQKIEEGLEGGQIKKKRYNPHRRQVQHRSEDGDVSSYCQAKNEHEFRRTERTSLAEELKQPSISDSLYDSFGTSQSAERKGTERCQSHGECISICYSFWMFICLFLIRAFCVC